MLTSVLVARNTRTTTREFARLRRWHGLRRVLRRFAVYLTAAVVALVCAGPLLASSFLTWPPGLTRIPLEALRTGALVVVITLALAVPSAYALTRLHRSWGPRLGTVLAGAFVVPPLAIFLPLSQLPQVNPVAIQPTITIPVAIWLLMGEMKAVPAEIEEQAMVDGHSRLGAFGRVVLPLTLPGILAVSAFSFTLATGEFLYTRAPGTPGMLDPATTLIVALPLALIVNLCAGRLASMPAQAVGME